MIKIITILFLIMFSSLSTFGQEVIGYGTIPKGSNELRLFPLPERKQSTEKDRRVIIDLDVSPNFYQADPRMPIAVPPIDLYSKFPIVKLPKDFPSDMPIYGLEEKCLEKRRDLIEKRSPGIKRLD
ncbi:MAG: hypothetical protein WD426_11200 [Anditalea sp.]